MKPKINDILEAIKNIKISCKPDDKILINSEYLVMLLEHINSLDYRLENCIKENNSLKKENQRLTGKILEKELDDFNFYLKV